MQPIQAIGAAPPQRVYGGDLSPGGGPSPSASGAPSFKDVLLNSIERARGAEQQASAAVRLLATGAGKPAEVLAAAQKADAALHVATQVRDALAAAYNELKDLRM
jgi:flagellar hook-basal body complex protein FliE